MKFEYKSLNLRHVEEIDMERLNKLGEEGWEVVAAIASVVILKREKK